MRQQLLDATGPVCGQPCEDVLHVSVAVVPTHASRLNQAHHRGSTLAHAQAAVKQPSLRAIAMGMIWFLIQLWSMKKLPVSAHRVSAILRFRL